MDYTRRSYRQGLCPAGMKAFTVTVKETDLWLAVDSSAMTPDLPGKVEQFVWGKRRLLERYISEEPAFLQALEPYVAAPGAPAIALDMVRAGNMAGVGPMAAVAGAFAQYVGEWLLQLTSQVIVENGGDIFLCCNRPVKVGIFAGESPFNEKLAIRIAPREEPRGICTSSGSVGPSYSRGRADAAVILAKSAILADAVATAAANMVQSQEDLQRAAKFAGEIKGVEGALVILGDKLAAWGEIELQGI
ncbi:MAG: UPF0280 family protein [Firmicutes bacterium]|jgi:ApbE superfamily uncharacterized protein (UPF0280 family)|nr:UPF0280 family protein [Bacillota bacterium]